MSLWDQLDASSEPEAKPLNAQSEQENQSGGGLWNEIGITRKLSAPTEIAYGALRGLSYLPTGLARVGEAIYSQPEAIGRKMAALTGQDYDALMADQRSQQELETLRGMAGGFRKTAETIEQVRKPIRPSESVQKGEGGLHWWLANAPEVTGQLASTLAVGAVTSPAGALALMSTSAGGSTYQEAKERMKARGDMSDYDIENMAALEGGASAITEAVLERLPLGEFFGKHRSAIVGKISKKLAATRPGRVAGAMAGESLEEMGADVSNMTMQYLAENDPKAFDGAMERLATSGTLGAFGGGVLAVPMQAYQQMKHGNLAEQATAEKQWKDQVREARHAFMLEGMTSDLSSTPEGLAKLQSLAAKTDPTRKDFEEAGYDPSKMKLNGEQRKAYAQSLAKRFQVQVPAAQPEVQPPAPPAPPTEPQPAPPAPEPAPAAPTFPGAAEQVQEPGKEYGRSLEADIKTAELYLKKFAKFKSETPEQKQALVDAARVFVGMMTPEQIAAVRAIEGGTPGSGALYQHTQKIVEEAQQITQGKTVSNEKKMFAPGGVMDRANNAAKRALGWTKLKVLNNQAFKELKSKIKGGRYVDPFKSGSAMDKNLDNAGIEKTAARAADEVAEFLQAEGSERFQNYYEDQNVEEDAIAAERFPEFGGNTPESAALNQFRRGVINAVASAQTELSKNTGETMQAWEGIRSTGRVPVVFTEPKTVVDSITGKTKTIDKPVFQLPKPDVSRAEGPLVSEVEQIIKAIQKMRPSVPRNVMDVLLKRKPVPEGLVQLQGKNKGQPVRTYKDYFYEWAAPKHVPSSAKREAFTTSKGLVLKMLVELETSTPEAFRDRVRTAFEIGGGTSMENKAENYRIIDKLLADPANQRVVNGRTQPDFAKVVAWLNERVPVAELNKIREGFGFSPYPPKILGDIVDTVYVAEGQETNVPRTFIFGPKVGAYMLNRMAEAHPKNADYNTMDVWESRFWRYIVDEKLSNDPGLASGAERKVFMRLANAFVRQMKERHGIDMKTSAGQAARWYLEKKKAADAGYAKAGETETIPEWTQRRMQDWRHTQLGMQETGFLGEQLAAAFAGEDYETIKAEAAQPVLPKKQAAKIAKIEKPPKPKKAPKPKPVKLTKGQKKEIAIRARGQELMFSDLNFEPTPEVKPAPRQQAAEAVRTIAPTGPTTTVTTDEVETPVETKTEPGQARGEAHGVPQRFVRPNGWVSLFRYSRAPRGEIYNIDPEQTQKQGYSRRDYDVSNVKRTFFYLDPTQKEAIIGNHMYGAEIEADRIYNLISDPEGLREKYKWGPKTDLQEVMSVLKKNGWAGLYYRTSDGMELVNLFVPVTGQSIQSQEEFTPASETTTEIAAAQPAVPPTEAPGIDESNIIATLFQKIGGRVVGSMEQIMKNGKVRMLLRAFKGSDIDTGLEEMAHALRRLIITRDLDAEQRGVSDEQLTAIEKRFGVTDGVWTVGAEEEFAREFRKRLRQGVKGMKIGNTKLQKAYRRLGNFLTNFYENVKRGVLGDQEVSKEMDDLFQTLAERRERLVRGAQPYVLRAITEAAALHSEELAKAGLAGGFTFNLKDGTYPKEGYAVAPSKASEYKIHIASTDPADVPRLIREFVEANKQTQARKGVNIGAWVSDGYLWLDNAIVENDLETAKSIGRANKQEAIWDLKNNVEISLKEKPSDQVKQAPDHGAKDQKKARAKGAKTKRGPGKAGGKPGPKAARTTLQGEQPAEPGAKAARGGAETTEASIQETLGEIEDQATIDSRLNAQAQGRVDWSPYTGPQGTRTGKAKAPLEVVRDILARVGISAAAYNPSSQPGVAGYYKFTMSMAQKIFEGTGRELYLAASHLADIGTAVHEVAHYIDNMLNISGFGGRLHKIGGLAPTLKGPGSLESADPATQYQFQMLDYHVAQHGQLRQDKLRGLAEGFAEAVRIYCQSPDPSATLTQDVKTFIDGLVMQNPEVAALMNQTRSEYQAYLNLPVAERVAFALASPDARNADPTESYYARQDRTGRSRGWWRLFVRKVQNRMRDVESMEQRTKAMFRELWKSSNEDVNEAWDKFLRQSGGLPSQFYMLAQGRIAHHTDQAVRFGIYDPITFNRIGDGAASIFANFNGKKEIEEFGKYMYAKVALLRWAQAQAEGTDYIVGQVDPGTLNQFVRDMEAGPNAAKYQQAMNNVTTYFNNLMQLQVAYGLKTQGEVDAMIAKHDIYMPFFRQIPSRVARTSRGTGGKYLGVKSSVRRLKGGSAFPVLDVYNAIVDRTSDVMSEVVRAAGEANFIKFAERSGVSGDFFRKLSAEEAAGMKNVTKLVRDGVAYNYLIDPDLKAALTQIGPQLSPVAASVLGVIGTPVDFAKKFLVTYNIPFFTTKNYLRDIKTTAMRGLQDATGIETADTTYLTAKAGLRGSADALKAVLGRPDQPTDVDHLFTSMGLERQTRVRTSRSKKYSKQQTRRIFLGTKDRSASQALGDWAANTAAYLEGINDAVELGPRREAFLMTLQLLGKTQGAGFSVDNKGKVTGDVPQWALTRAANNALEVTTNFNRRGEWQPYLEPIFMFFNAAVQGTAGMGMTVKNVLADLKNGKGKPHAKRFAIAVALAATAKIAQLSIMALMHPDDDDEELSMLDLWAEQADYVRGASDVWMFSKRFGISIPREREWGFFYRAVDDAVAQAVRDGANPWSLHLFAKELLKPANVWKQTATELEQRIPLSGGMLSMGAQLFFNYDLFRGREIEDKWEKGKLPKYRYDERTGSAARWLGAAAQAAADVTRVEALAVSPRQWDFILRQEFGSLPGKLIEDVYAVGAPDKLRRNNLPFVGPFLTDPTARQSIADYYEMRERSGMEFDEWKNDRRELPESTVQRILDNEATVGVTDSVLKLIREWPEEQLSQESKAKYQTGVTRWALERNALDEYPNPLLQYLSNDLPDELKIALLKVLKREASEKPRVDETMKAKPERYRQALEARERLRPRLIGKEE